MTPSTRWYKNDTFILVVVFFLSRIAYWYFTGIRFYARPLVYPQYVDPALLQKALFQSLWYLKEQMPGFNLFLGIIYNLFPTDHNVVFQIIYLALTLGTSLIILSLLIRLGVPSIIALLIACGYAVNPNTVLYEHWLFYNAPIVFLFGLSAWSLHRYLSDRRTGDCVLFFLSLLGLGMLRTLYHAAWYLLLAALLLMIMPAGRRTIAWCAGVPFLVLGGVYLKSLLLFGYLVPGQAVYGGLNHLELRLQSIQREDLEHAVQAGRVPKLALVGPYDLNYKIHGNLFPLRPPTGIPVLDETNKSDGTTNWNSFWMQDAMQTMESVVPALNAEFPWARRQTLLRNIVHYGLPESEITPFFRGGDYPLTKTMRSILEGCRDWIYCFPGTHRPYMGLAILGTLLASGFWRNFLYLKECAKARKVLIRANDLVVLFCTFNILYLAVITIVASHDEAQRYRNEVSVLYAVLLGLLVTDLWRWFVSARTAPGKLG